jgi:hypothetical protein
VNFGSWSEAALSRVHARRMITCPSLPYLTSIQQSIDGSGASTVFDSQITQAQADVAFDNANNDQYRHTLPTSHNLNSNQKQLLVDAQNLIIQIKSDPVLQVFADSFGPGSGGVFA